MTVLALELLSALVATVAVQVAACIRRSRALWVVAAVMSQAIAVGWWVAAPGAFRWAALGVQAAVVTNLLAARRPVARATT